MRAAISALLVIVFALVVVLVLLALRRAIIRREARRKLIHELAMLRNFRTLTTNEVEVQEQAGYSDVTAFRHLLNDIKELN